MSSEDIAQMMAEEGEEYARDGWERRGAAMWVRPTQAADVALAQPDAQVEAPQEPSMLEKMQALIERHRNVLSSPDLKPATRKGFTSNMRSLEKLAAQLEAPQRKACPMCGENELGCKQFGCWSAPQRTIDTSDAEPWPDEVFTAPADDVPVDPHDNFRPDLTHEFKEGYYVARCAHRFKWLGGDVMCGCPEHHPLHPRRNVPVDQECE